MIFDINEESLDLLVITACPEDLWANEHCVLIDDELYNSQYNGSCIDACRACWLKWLSKESEDKHE